MLKVITPSTPLPEFVNPFGFPLDPFQIHACSAIEKGENVLVTAKTGSGKTLVGEYQIQHTLAKGKRVFYTTPIKSLSNQKFHDLKKMYPGRVGIMTGDIKFAPQADIVILTTELLRNLLFKRGTDTESIGLSASLSLDNVEAVIFDEVHYINDPDRGKVWEECLTLLPREIQLVLLSATLYQPEIFAKWLGDLKQIPLHLISTTYRVVPLIHHLPNGAVVMDEKEVFRPEAYKAWIRSEKNAKDEARKHTEAVKNRIDEQVVKRTSRDHSFTFRMNAMIRTMESKEQLPALFFVFSRKNCEKQASLVDTHLLDSSESAEVRHILSQHLHRYPDVQATQQYFRLLPLLEKGVAFHHSGVLPILKEMIEILFAKGFVKVLFATETFAVGLNMPTKTVIFTSYQKRDDATDGFRVLYPSEYTQMAGRAGRRGKDTQGLVFYLPDREPESFENVKAMMTGHTATVHSRMDLGYSYILSTTHASEAILPHTFYMVERQKMLADVEGQLDEIRSTFPHLDEFKTTQCEIREQLERGMIETVNAERRGFQQKLEKWKNTHIGPQWESAWATHKLRKDKLRDIGILEGQKREQELEPYEITARTAFLKEMGFLNDFGLTMTGTLASEIHEGNPLLLAKACESRMFMNLSGEQITCMLSMFLETHEEESAFVPADLEKSYRDLGTFVKLYSTTEPIHSDLSFWALHTYWISMVRHWLNSDEPVWTLHGVEEGTFVRAMLKLANLVEEWISMCTIVQDTEMIEKMKDIPSRILKGIVIPDSLYLRI